MNVVAIFFTLDIDVQVVGQKLFLDFSFTLYMYTCILFVMGATPRNNYHMLSSTLSWEKTKLSHLKLHLGNFTVSSVTSHGDIFQVTATPLPLTVGASTTGITY